MKKGDSTLVVVFPETRAFFLTFDLFKKNVLNALDADLCLCVKNDVKEVLDNPFYKSAKHTFIYPEELDWSDPTKWGEAFDFAQRVEGCSGNWRQLLTVPTLWLGEEKNGVQSHFSPTITIFFRWYLKKKLIEEDLVSQYDWFVLTRSDFLHRIPHVPMQLLDKEHIWIPDGEDWGGFTDRHIVVSRKYIEDILSIADPIIHAPDKLLEEMLKESHDWNLERYIKYSFEKLGLASQVRRYPYTMFTVRKGDTHTTWGVGNYSPRLGYHVKYDGEYRSYFVASKIIKTSKDWTKDSVQDVSNLINYERMTSLWANPESSNKGYPNLHNKRRMLMSKLWSAHHKTGFKGAVGTFLLSLAVMIGKLHIPNISRINTPSNYRKWNGKFYELK